MKTYIYLKNIDNTLTILVSESEMPPATTDNKHYYHDMITLWESDCKQYPCADKENAEAFVKFAIEPSYITVSVLSQGIKIPNERVEIICKGCDWNKNKPIGPSAYACCPDSKYFAYYIPIEEDVKEETQEELWDSMFQIYNDYAGTKPIKDILSTMFTITRI